MGAGGSRFVMSTKSKISASSFIAFILKRLAKGGYFSVDDVELKTLHNYIIVKIATVLYINGTPFI